MKNHTSQILLQKSSDLPVKTLGFHVKIGRFSLKNRKIFLKPLSAIPAICQEKLTTFSGRFYDFLLKINRFLDKNLRVFTGKSEP